MSRKRRQYNRGFKAKIAFAAPQKKGGADHVGDRGPLRDPPNHGEPVETRTDGQLQYRLEELKTLCQ
ncbi:hypothetical protein CWB90_23690 [Pseudoalteromonas piscicida]|nr:hypothetical protein CWB90_23690 [Pseudoalteromonas piscicida]